MRWYPLRDAVAPFLGERLTTLFAHAVSAQTDCLICSTFFRRLLIDAGEDPDALELDELDELIAEFGRRLAIDPHDVDDELYARLAERFDDQQVVLLTAFGAIMLATNVFNDALRVARAIETGVLSVNSNTSVRVATPFGGFKQSGYGRELGPHALDAYTEVKTISFATESP